MFKSQVLLTNAGHVLWELLPYVLWPDAGDLFQLWKFWIFSNDDQDAAGNAFDTPLGNVKTRPRAQDLEWGKAELCSVFQL